LKVLLAGYQSWEEIKVMVARSQAPEVLIADAEPYVCRVFEARLSKDGQFRVASATTGAAALQCALLQVFDVLLWDMRLRDTASLLPRLRALCPRAALLLMTTDDRPVLHLDVRRLDIADVLVKPFGLDTLAERVHRAAWIEPPPAAAAQIDLVRVGQQLSVISPGGVCVTRVLESWQDTFVIVGAPRVETPLDFAPGLRVRVEVRGSDALYSFASKLLRLHLQPVARWELAMPSVIRRTQRRHYPRLPLHLMIALTEPAAGNSAQGRTGAGGQGAQGRVEGKEAPTTLAVGIGEKPLPGSWSLAPTPQALPTPEEERRVASGITEDIGLGGCGFLSDTPLPIGATYRFVLQYPALQRLEGMGVLVQSQPVWSVETGVSTLPQYRLSLQFLTMPPADRHRLRALLKAGG
jgi:CheY-like chemotaxis protein/c-di-GMP-binding flagellar brake protein YcgR